MIETLNGKCSYILPDRVIIDVQGVGYSVFLPTSVICNMPEVGQEAFLWIYTHVKEDILKLYGFQSYEQKMIFQTLISVSGVGPKVGLAILSTLSPGDVVNAILTESKEAFEAVPGIGKRTAEKMLVDLKPKLEKLEKAFEMLNAGGAPLPVTTVASDDGHKRQIKFNTVFLELASALENLGYKSKQVNAIIKTMQKDHGGELGLQELLKLSLNKLSENTLQVEKSDPVKQASSSHHLQTLF